jgi:hypothetical protein
LRKKVFPDSQSIDYIEPLDYTGCQTEPGCQEIEGELICERKFCTILAGSWLEINETHSIPDGGSLLIPFLGTVRYLPIDKGSDTFELILEKASNIELSYILLDEEKGKYVVIQVGDQEEFGGDVGGGCNDDEDCDGDLICDGGKCVEEKVEAYCRETDGGIIEYRRQITSAFGGPGQWVDGTGENVCEDNYAKSFSCDRDEFKMEILNCGEVGCNDAGTACEGEGESQKTCEEMNGEKCDYDLQDCEGTKSNAKDGPLCCVGGNGCVDKETCRDDGDCEEGEYCAGGGDESLGVCVKDKVDKGCTVDTDCKDLNGLEKNLRCDNDNRIIDTNTTYSCVDSKCEGSSVIKEIEDCVDPGEQFCDDSDSNDVKCVDELSCSGSNPCIAGKVCEAGICVEDGTETVKSEEKETDKACERQGDDYYDLEVKGTSSIEAGISTRGRITYSSKPDECIDEKVRQYQCDTDDKGYFELTDSCENGCDDGACAEEDDGKKSGEMETDKACERQGDDYYNLTIPGNSRIGGEGGRGSASIKQDECIDGKVRQYQCDTDDEGYFELTDSCDETDVCENGICGDRTCVEGCEYPTNSEECYNAGSKINRNNFCSAQGQVNNTLSNGNKCEENFQCESNKCCDRRGDLFNNEFVCSAWYNRCW